MNGDNNGEGYYAGSSELAEPTPVTVKRLETVRICHVELISLRLYSATPRLISFS